jgi:hypothetical protein
MDIKPVVFEVLSAILVDNWRVFFPSSVAARALGDADVINQVQT